MADLPKLDWLRIRETGGLQRIAKFVRGKPVNTYSLPRQDRKGDWIIMLGWDDRPNSDWGRFKGNRAAIWFASQALAEVGEAHVRKALGWPAQADAA